MNKKLIYIDFEYNRSSNLDMGLISCSFQIDDDPEKFTYWLRDKEEFQKCKDHLSSLKGNIMVAFAVELAESRCVNALGLHPMDFQWIDLMVLHRWLGNHDNKFTYGRIIKLVNGYAHIYRSCPPIARYSKKASKAEKEDADRRNYMNARARGFNSIAPVGGSLLDCLVFYDIIQTSEELNHDYKRKNDVRNYIIAGIDLEKRKDEILEYNESDIHLMPLLYKRMKEEMEIILKQPCVVIDPARSLQNEWPPLVVEKESPFEFFQVALEIGKWCAFKGWIATKGVPLNEDRCRQIQYAAPKILEETKINFNNDHWKRYRIESSDDNFKSIDHSMEDLDGYYTLLAKRRKVKVWPFVKRKIIEDSASAQEWVTGLVKEFGYAWPKTESGAWSTASPDLERLAQQSDFCPIKTYLRQTKAIDSINGLAKGFNEGLWGTVGDDFIHRFKSNPYRTQTSRDGLGASSYLYSCPQWFRVLVDPKEGETYVSCDFSSQEVFIGGAVPRDQAVINSYNSGDQYWAFGALSGIIPRELKIPTEDERGHPPWSDYGKQRQTCKTVVLGIGFGMASGALSQHLTLSTGIPHNRDQAQVYIDKYERAYAGQTKFRSVLKYEYQRQKLNIFLADGWRHGPDNPTPNSFLNQPIQGTGGVILRKSCYKLYEAGFDVRHTTHDEIGFMLPNSEVDSRTPIAKQLMIDASDEVLGVKGMRVGNPEIVTKGHLWMHSGRAKADFNRYKHHFAFAKEL